MLTVLTCSAMTVMGSEDETGVLGRVYENGLPVTYALDDSEPSRDLISRLPWLTAVSREYDGSDNNGMPLEATNSRMIELENAVTTEFESSSNSIRVSSRTGNHQ